MTKTRKPKRDAIYVVPAAEIAKAMNITPQRVYQLEAKALRKIRKGLAERGYGGEITDLPGWAIEYILASALIEAEQEPIRTEGRAEQTDRIILRSAA